MAANGCHQKSPGHGGQAHPGAVAQKVPHRRLGHIAGNLGGIAQAQDLIDRAKNNQGNERGQKRTQAQVANQNAVDRAQQAAAHYRAQHRHGHWPLQDVHHHQRAKVGQGKDGADRQVNAAHNHHQCQAKHNKAHFTGLAQGVGHHDGGVKAGHQLARGDDHQRQQDHGNSGLGPALGQDLAKPVVRPVPVTQSGQGFAHGVHHFRGNKEKRVATPQGSSHPNQPGPRRPGLDAYLAGSFQQVPSMEAFSLVIGIKVV